MYNYCIFPRSADDTRAITTSQTSVSRSKLLHLPTELVEMIFDEINDWAEAIFLCLAHEWLGAIGERRVYEIVLESLAPWAGKRIACVSKYTRDDDWPPQLRPYLDAWGQQLEDSGGRNETREFYTFVEKRYRRLHGVPWLYGLMQRRFKGSNLTVYDMRKCKRLSEGVDKLEKSNRVGPSRVLCNLSKGEFVRESAVEDLRSLVLTGEKERLLSSIDLGQVLLSMICWASSDWCAMSVDCKRLSRGPWAGDQFELIELDKLREGMTWRDVTEEVLVWVEELWRDDQRRRDSAWY